MSESTALFLKAIAGLVTGLLVSTGHLDSSNQNTFSDNMNAFAGAILTVLSGGVILIHAYESAIKELHWKYTPDTDETTPTPPAAVITATTTQTTTNAPTS